jgi:hypothetical protein
LVAFRLDHFIHGFVPGARVREAWANDATGKGMRLTGNFGSGGLWVSSERRKNGGRFPVLLANHQRFVAMAVATAQASRKIAKLEGRRKAGLIEAQVR